MKETFLYALRAILPILLLMLLGYVVRWLSGWERSFFRRINQLCFRLFLPLQLFCSVYAIDSVGDINWRMIAFLLCGVGLSLGLGMLAAALFIPRREQKGVIIQAAFRSNQAILGLPLAAALGGSAALAFASVATSVCIPVFNLLAVVLLTHYSQRPGADTPARLVRRVAANPLILGVAAGFIVVLIRGLLPTVDGTPVFTIQNQLPSLYQALTELGQVASPLMLFVLGTQLDFSSLKSLWPQVALGTVLRLAVSPALAIGLVLHFRVLLNLTVTEVPSLLAVFASPVAVSTAVMVQEIGGDEQLANQLVVWTSVLSMGSIFCIICVLRLHGFL